MICRVCGSDNHALASKFELVRYADRHSAHADCGLKKWGAAFFQRLQTWQLEQFPALAAIQAGVTEQLSAEIERRHHMNAMARATYSLPRAEVR